MSESSKELSSEYSLKVEVDRIEDVSKEIDKFKQET